MIRMQRGKPSEDFRDDCIARGVRAAAFRRHDDKHKKYSARRARAGVCARVSRRVASGRAGIRER